MLTLMLMMMMMMMMMMFGIRDGSQEEVRAVKFAKPSGAPQDIVFCGSTTYVVGCVRLLFGHHGCRTP